MTCVSGRNRSRCASVPRLILPILIVTCVGLIVAPAYAATGAAQSDARLVRELANELNAARLEAGLPGLRYSPALAMAATVRARQLARQGWAGRPLAGRALQRRIGRFYPRRTGARALGETVLWSNGYICGSAVFTHWLGAARDRVTVLGSGWREAGIAAVRLPNGHRFAVIEYGVR
jgi:uncharacterized protein YkwD